MKVEFSADGAPIVDGEFVTRSGKIFETGDYKHQAFSLNAKEMQAACDNHRSAGLNVQHGASIFDLGDMGSVPRIWNDGKELHGEVKLDRHLDAYFEKHHIPIRVSAEWNRKTKTLENVALVYNPAITDAAVYAAFSRDPAEFARGSVASMHDNAVYAGAECNGKSMFADGSTAEFMTPDDLKKIQKVHDLCSGEGKHCDAMASRNAMYSAAPTGADNGAQLRAGKSQTMTFKEKMAALFHKAGVPKEEVDLALADDDTPPPAATPAAFSQADRDALKAEFSAQLATRDAQIANLSATFAEREARAVFAQNTDAITDLKRSGRMTAAEGAEYLELARTNPAAFAANLPILKGRAPLVQFARRPGDIQIASTPEEPTQALLDKTHAYAKANNVSFSEAAKAILRENPELESAHFAATSAQQGGK